MVAVETPYTPGDRSSDSARETRVGRKDEIGLAAAIPPRPSLDHVCSRGGASGPVVCREADDASPYETRTSVFRAWSQPILGVPLWTKTSPMIPTQAKPAAPIASLLPQRRGLDATRHIPATEHGKERRRKTR